MKLLLPALFLTGILSAQSSADLLDEGNKYFQAAEYAQAVEPYQKAFEKDKSDKSDKSEAKLDPARWRTLIGNLAISQRAIGKLTAAEQVLEYGISKDPANPLFCYQMATIWGDRNQVRPTIKWLRMALENRANLHPGDGWPDPHKEVTFQRFLKNDELRSVLRAFE